MNHEKSERPHRHPLHAAHEEIANLVDVAERGESAASPAVLIGGVGLVLVPLVAIIVALAFAVGYVGTRGSDSPVTVSASAQTASHVTGSSDRPVREVSLPREVPPLLQTRQEALMETFWTIVSYAVLIGLFALPLALIALLWRAAGRQRTA
jgi:hypothetical protein